MKDMKLTAMALSMEAFGVFLWVLRDILPGLCYLVLAVGTVFLAIAIARYALPVYKTVYEVQGQKEQKRLEAKALSYEHQRALKAFEHQRVQDIHTQKLQWAVLSYAMHTGAQIDMPGVGKVFTHQLPAIHVQEIREDQKLLSSGYPSAPPFASIKSLIRPGKLILGYNMQGPIYGDVADLLSMLFGGKPGTGKSTALLYYLSMLLLVEAQVYAFDHQGSLSELSGLIPYFGSFREFAEPMPEIRQEIKEREELWRNGRQVRKPMLILADELPAVARYEEKNKVKYSLLGLAEDIVLEYRKYNVYCLLTGQSFPADVLPTITRDNCSSRILFNSSADHARMAGLDAESRKKMLPLLKRAPQGTAILDVSRRPEPDIVALPYTTVDDARAIINARISGNAFTTPLAAFPRHSQASQEGQYDAYDDDEDTFPVKADNGVNELLESRESIPDVSPKEREKIIQVARVQLATTGKVVRSKIPAALEKNNRYYDTVKKVLDEAGL